MFALLIGQNVSGRKAYDRALIDRCLRLLSELRSLFLDEPIAIPDPVAETQAYESFDRLVEGKTAVYISH